VKGLAAVGGLLVLVPLLVLLSPVIAAMLASRAWRARALRLRFARTHGPGTRGILVYSDSPNWQRYIEERWLPRIGTRLVVLNWSERARWTAEHPLEAAIVRHHLGDRAFNPAAIVYRAPPEGPHVVRFLEPFRDFKHGKEQKLRAAEAELWTLLDEPDAPRAGD
jgi:hypothetical protein